MRQDKNPKINEQIDKQTSRIKEVASIYSRLKSLMPNYKSEYLDAYEEIANRFNNTKRIELN